MLADIETDRGYAAAAAARAGRSGRPAEGSATAIDSGDADDDGILKV